MAKTIEKVKFQKQIPKPKRVAAYARVSSAKDAMHHSLSAQVSYYSSYIQNHPGWEYAGVYADEAKSGTKDSRENFQRLLMDARAGNIAIIITKSISRFARNTGTLFETVRELKAFGVDIYFEEQSIHTLSSEGELMLSILASFAQAESQSVSDNMKWRVKKNFEEGIPWDTVLIGYRFKDGRIVPEPSEATIVIRIFNDYLAGNGTHKISKELNTEGLLTRRGFEWSSNTVTWVLRNYNYTGNLLLQKTYRKDYISKTKAVNNGEFPKYHETGTHEALVSLDDFNKVQEKLKAQSEHFAPKNNAVKRYPSKLLEATADIALTDVTEIIAEDGNMLYIRMADGTEITRHWEYSSIADSWTDEMKEKARVAELERRKQNG